MRELLYPACAVAAGLVLLLSIVIRIMIRKAVNELKDTYAVKTQLLQEELHEVYVRAVNEKPKRKVRYAKRSAAGHRRRRRCGVR